ncbi:Solute carrier 2 [Mactra antiquata]
MKMTSSEASNGYVGPAGIDLTEHGNNGIPNKQFYDSIEIEKVPVTPKKTKITAPLCLAVFSAIMGSVSFGYNTGVINAPETDIKEFMNHTEYSRTGSSMADSKITSLYSLIVAIFAVGGMVGGLTAGWWADYFGRKFGMILNNIVGILACVLMFISRTTDAYELIIVGRFLVGISCGLFTGLTPMYLSEISSAEIRGALGTLHQLGVVIGLLTSQVLGFPEIFGNSDYWNLLLGVGVTPCVIQILSMPLCPETPRYLLIKKSKESQAIQALKRLRGTNDVYDDINEIKSESKSTDSDESISIIGLFRTKSLRMPLIISIIMQLSQQLAGINAIFYYSLNLFTYAGIEKSTAAHAVSGVGGTMILMTVVTIPLMDKLGRRTLHLIGLAGMFIFSIMITLSLSLMYLADWLKICNIVVSLLYVLFFAVGPGSIPWLIVSELFSQGPRPAAMSVSVVVNWLANFTVGYCFPYMQSGLGDFSFLPFTVFLGLFFIFTYKFVPETKNRTIEDISQQWRR